MEKRAVVIVGAGPAGLTAALYARRAGLDVLVLEKMAAGGQMLQTEKIKNYPGVMGATGAELAGVMRAQAEAVGAEFLSAEVMELQRENGGIALQTDEGKIMAETVIIATGVTERKLEVPGEAQLVGRGVSYCTMCDGALYAGKTVAVYGGGNSAVYSVLELAKICRKVYLIYRGTNMRAEKVLVEKAEKLENVEFMLETQITEVLGADRLEEVQLEKTTGGEPEKCQLDGLFVQIGKTADVQWCPELAVDKSGYIEADENCQTNLPGVYAAGDVRAKTARQIVTAAADGAVAATAIIRAQNC